ncbi:hypothetical protein IMG5_105000, partial [Ichthyophthirius multifiliis]
MSIGVLARILAQKEIVEDVCSIILKGYYKKSALQLCEKRIQEEKVAFDKKQ